jgi:hypothetical protein
MRLVQELRHGARANRGRDVRRVFWYVEPHADGCVVRPQWTHRARAYYLNRQAVVLFYWLLGLHVERHRRRHNAPFNKRDTARRAERRFRVREREAWLDGNG